MRVAPRRFTTDNNREMMVSSDHRLLGRASGAVARLRAEGQSVRLQSMHGGTLWRRTIDGEWERLGSEEIRARFGSTFRIDLETVYFELPLSLKPP